MIQSGCKRDYIVDKLTVIIGVCSCKEPLAHLDLLARNAQALIDYMDIWDNCSREHCSQGLANRRCNGREAYDEKCAKCEIAGVRLVSNGIE